MVVLCRGWRSYFEGQDTKKNEILMKIVHVIDSLATGGAERLVVDLADYGIRQGHDVRIAILRDSPGIPRSRADELKIPLTILGDSLKDPRHLYRIRSAVADADIVHVHLFPALYWSVLAGKPAVFTEHNTHNRRMDKLLYRLPERVAYQNYSKVIAISDGVADAIESHLRILKLNTGVTVAVNGIADEYFEVKRLYADRPSQIVSVGSFSPRKQHHLAIEAVSILDDVTLKIAGDGPLRESLEAKIEDLRLQDRVELLGNIKDIPGLLAESDLFLSTSSVEGFGIAAGEAQASGLPVVGPDIPGLNEVVLDGKSGLLFKDFDPESIADTIHSALNADNYHYLADHARENASRYSLANSFESQMKVYREVLG